MFARATGLVKLVGLCLAAGVLLAAVMFPVVGGLGLASNRAAETVDQTSGELAKGELPLVTTVQDMNGEPIAYLYDQYRIPVEYDQIADTMKAAIIAIEDKRFFLHKGVDWQGIARAAAKAGAEGEVSQGASTLTQQYVKNYLAFVIGKGSNEAYEKATEATAGRKLREARVALQLEQVMTKEEILTAYLNIVPFGNGTYGVGAASKAYFDTTPDKLTVPQAAMLAGLVNQPSVLNPGNGPEAAIKRRNTVIDRMRDNEAFGTDQAVSDAKANEYKAAEAGVVPDLNLLPNGCVGAGDGPVYGFFCRYLIDYLEKSGLPFEELRRGGYTIKTTMDPIATRAAKESAESQVAKDTEGVANAMAVVEPGTDKHRVRALAANRDFGNNAEAGQSAYSIPAEVTPFGAGSIYKVFTAAAALDKGVTGIDKEIDVPNSYTSRVYKDGSKPYTVKNYSQGTDTKMTLTKALATSPNTGFIILEEKAGLDNVIDMAYKLGLRQTMHDVNGAGEALKADGSNGPSQGDQFKQDNSGSFTLGPGATSVLELANVAATIVSHGTWCPPTPVEEILDRNGRPVQLKEVACDQPVSPELADSLAQGMSHDTLPGGTAAAASQGFNRPMIGKTGTTENYWSVAFMGATPQYAGAVMTFTDGVAPQVICDARAPRLCGNNGRTGLTGGEVAAPTWFRAMKTIHEGKPVAPLPPAAPRYR